MEMTPGATIDEIRSLAKTNQRKALKQLRKAGATTYEAFGVEGTYHDQYLSLYAELTSRQAVLPSVAIALWSKWDRPTNGLLIDHAKGLKEDVLYLVAPRKKQQKSAAAEAEALLTLSTNEDCPLVIIGEADLMVRTRFLADVEALVPLDAEDVCQDLIDAAATRNLKGRWITV